jgi:hypothetical protein
VEVCGKQQQRLLRGCWRSRIIGAGGIAAAAAALKEHHLLRLGRAGPREPGREGNNTALHGCKEQQQQQQHDAMGGADAQVGERGFDAGQKRRFAGGPVVG